MKAGFQGGARRLEKNMTTRCHQRIGEARYTGIIQRFGTVDPDNRAAIPWDAG